EGEEPKPMMHGPEKSDLVIVAMKPANKAKEAHCGGVCGASAAESVERRAGAKGNTHQHNTYWTQSQARVTNALERIRPLSPSYTRGGSRMRESRTYGSVRGACGETHVPTATEARVHHAARRRRVVAARGAGAAVGMPMIGLGGDHETARIHWPARRDCDIAAGGAGADDQKAAACRMVVLQSERSCRQISRIGFGRHARARRHRRPGFRDGLHVS